MIEVFHFAALGLGAGGLYALAAIGLVLVYRSSGVVNFAQVGIGLIGAYAFYEARVVRDLPAAVALPIGMCVSAAAGLLFHVIVLRRMRDASTLARIVVTLALLVILQGTAGLIYGPLPRLVPSMLPVGPVRIFGAYIGADRLWIFGIVIVLTTVLWVVYRQTSFGLATTAVAENPRAASAVGVSPDLIGAANWAIGGALGALAVILLVPITGLGSDNITLLVIPVLAAAVVGRFSSFPVTTAAGLAIGVAQSWVTRYVDQPGWGTAVPFLVVTAVLLARGRPRAGKDEPVSRLPALGSGRLSPTLILLGSAGALAAIWWLLPSLWLNAFMIELIVAVILMSFVIVTGFAGQVSLAQFSFAAIGASGATWLMARHGWPFALALIGGVAITIPVGVLVGLAAFRTRGLNLAIVTLGFAIALEAVVFGNFAYTGKFLGPRGPSLRFAGIDVAAPRYVDRYATFSLLVLVVVAIAVANLRRGRAGRRLIAVRTNERAAAALGVSVVGAKVYAFVLGGAIAGLGGILLADRQPFIQLGDFSSLQSILSTQYAVLGGVGTIGGPLVGSVLHPAALGPRLFGFLGGHVAVMLSIATNVALIAMLTVAPDGVATAISRLDRGWLRIAQRGGRRRDLPATTVPSAAGAGTVEPRRLEVEHLTVRFGGVTALEDLTMVVNPGEVVGLIGPNGAGKSTAIEAITGFVAPAAGTVRVGGSTVDRWGPERRSRAGLSRSFQSLDLFEDLTVLENIQAACDRRDVLAYVTDLVKPGVGRLTALAALVVADFGLDADLRTKVRQLPYARRRLLAVARAAAAGQSVLLLDEPAAGLDDAQVERLAATIRRLARERGVAVLLVEHNVDMVLRTCDRVYALDFGRLIGEGQPAEIRVNDAVIDAYLGRRPHRAGGS